MKLGGCESEVVHPTLHWGSFHTHMGIFWGKLAFSLWFRLSSTHKQIFCSIKQELLEKSFQGEDFRKLRFCKPCLQETGAFWRSLLCATFLLKSKQNQNSASLSSRTFYKCLEKCTSTLSLNWVVVEEAFFLHFYLLCIQMWHPQGTRLHCQSTRVTPSSAATSHCCCSAFPGDVPYPFFFSLLIGQLVAYS